MLKVQTKKYQDKFRRRRRNRFVFKAILWLIVFLALGGSAYYALFFSGIFEIKEIVIEGPAKIGDLVVRDYIDQWLDSNFLGAKKRSNSLIFGQGNLAGSISNQSSKIASVTVDREDTHHLKIIITERKPAGVWCYIQSESCYYFDSNGVAYAKTGSTSGFIYLKVSDEINTAGEIGKETADESWLKTILAFAGAISGETLSISEYNFPKDYPDELRIKTSLGFYIRIDLKENIEKQITALKLLISEKPQILKSGLTYIDLRVPDRIYYK